MADATYSAEFTITVDKLKKGVVETKAALDDLEKAAISAGERSGESLTSALEKGLENASAALKKAEKDIRAYAEVTGDSAGAVNQSIKAHEDYIAALVKEAQAHGDTGGQIKKSISEHQKQIKALEKGKGAADGFGKGVKKGFDEAGKQAAKFGTNVVKSLGPLGLILAAVTAAINFVNEKLGAAIGENEKASASFEKIGNIIDAVVTPIFNGLATAIGFVADLITGLIDKFTNGGASAKAYAAEVAKLEKVVKDLEKEFSNELKLTRERNKVYKDENQHLQETLAAHQKYLDALIAEKAANGDVTGALQKRIDVEIGVVNQLKSIAESKKETVAVESEESKLLKERDAILEKLKAQMKQMELHSETILDEEERKQYVEAQTLEIYKSTQSELEGFIVKSGWTRDIAVKTFAAYDGVVAKVHEMSDSMEETNRSLALRNELDAADEEYKDKTQSLQWKLNNGLIEEKEYQTEIIKATEQHNLSLGDIVARYDDVANAADIAKEHIKPLAEQPFDFSKLSADISVGLGYYSQAAGSVLQITQAMAEDQIDAINNLLEQQKELIDQQYEETMARLEEERQAALEAAGFVQAVTEEGQAMALEAAVASGDEGLIYKEKRRQEELAINKKFDDAEKKATDAKLAAEKKAEEDAARQIAQVQYQQAMAEWVNSLIQAGVNTAVAVTAALPSIPLSVIVGALGALQIAAISANVPKPPAFAEGGVVGLPRTYHSAYANGGIVEANTPRGVDAVPIIAANNEMLLNDDQQVNLFNAIASGNLGGGEITLIIQNIIDGLVAAESTVKFINDGLTHKIINRMIE